MRTNGFLSRLPAEVAQRLLQGHLRRVYTKRTVLQEAGEPFEHTIFPLSGMLSLLSTTEEGNTIEVMSVGREGMIGLPILRATLDVPYSVQVQLPAEVIQIKASTLRSEMKMSPLLQEILLEYVQERLQGMAQLAVCHRFHSARQRFCRWLLAARDHAESNVLEFTQEAMAQNLGIPRTAVTAIAVELQDAGALRCRHGRVTILNRAPLEATACDCNRVRGTAAVRQSLSLAGRRP